MQLSCKRIILEHDVFASFANADAVGIGGREAAFDLQSFMQAVNDKDLGTYKAGCPLFWQDMSLDPLIAHVPLKRKQIMRQASNLL